MPDKSQMLPMGEWSVVARKLTRPGGILTLMEDLGRALTEDPEMRMLGGGNPAAVPGLQALLRERMSELLAEGDAWERLALNYDPPQGNPRFLQALAGLLQREYGWEVTPRNLAVTHGGQTACFYLFNLFGGDFGHGKFRRILLPLAPEYMGYAGQGLAPDMFLACQPRIEWPAGGGGREFKYAVDFAAVEAALAGGGIGAIAASRPSNPSGNVLTDAEVARLAALAAAHQIPLILDQAYGPPFPDLLHVPARPFWDPQTIVVLSLSKLGLPGARTGVVLAPEPVVAALSALTAVTGLASGNLGQQLVRPWLESGRMLKISREILKPFYAEKRRLAAGWARQYFDAAGVDWALHAAEGAFFHWLWLRQLPITTRQLYERLKARKVLTVPGEDFFFGLATDWPHRHECLRLNYSGDEAVVQEGYRLIAEEAARAGRR